MQTELPRQSTKDNSHALRILAKSVLRELRASGYRPGDIVAFASEMLDLLREEMKTERGE